MSARFEIPTTRLDLLNELRLNYSVRNVFVPGELIAKVGDGRRFLQEDGSAFILNNFDTYYSVLHNADKLKEDLIFKAFTDLQMAVKKLDNFLAVTLNEKDNLNDEEKERAQDVLKMLIYIFTQFILYYEQKLRKTQNNIDLKKKKNKNDDHFQVNKAQVLNLFNNIIQREIRALWNTQVVEVDFVNLFAEVCFSFLQNASIKQEKKLRDDVFELFGNLIKSYDYGRTFICRLISAIRVYEHLVTVVPEGIKLLVNQFNCKTYVHHLVKEATEWQVNETYQDNQGVKTCSTFLTNLAILLPDLMIPEVMYLNQYLSYESIPLRTSVLNVITEIILKVLTADNLNDEQKEFREEFFEILLEHLSDITGSVRSKVISNFCKLQQEHAIPLCLQIEILGEIILHLRDKSIAARKAAISAVTVFLQYNPFGATLHLKNVEAELTDKHKRLNHIEEMYREAQENKIKELMEQWNQIEEDLKNTITKHLEKNDGEDSDGEGEEEEENDQENQERNKDERIAKMRAHLFNREYIKAIKLCEELRKEITEWKHLKKKHNADQVAIYLVVLRSVFLNIAKIKDELRTGVGMSSEDIKEIESFESSIKYFETIKTFLEVLNSAIEPMKQLLISQAIGDMHEAIDFFVTAYQFQIDGAADGVLEMLKLIRYNEPERKNAVVEAFKKIYLMTEAENMWDHTSLVVNRLTSFLKQVSFDNLEDLECIIAEWTSKKILDNAIIEQLWNNFTRPDSPNNDDSRAACELLRMAALGNQNIIVKNISVVAAIAFSERYRDDMKFLSSACRFMAMAGFEKIDIQSKHAPFRISHKDLKFDTLTTILTEKFFCEVPFYSEALEASIDFIFRMCSNPTVICQNIIKIIYEKMQSTEKTLLIIIRFIEFCGTIAVRILGYLDNSIYRELKRRNYLTEAIKENSKNKKNNNSKQNKGKSATLSMLDASQNESVLLGADAEDVDAEFILNVLENCIVFQCGIGQFDALIENICENPQMYNNKLHMAATVALMRFMLVSSKFCEKKIRLLFTILEKSSSVNLQCIVLIHCTDLLIRFPNIVEPWTPRIYRMLKHSVVQVRKTAFFILSNLVLRDMIKVRSHISEMAACMFDPSREIADICKIFFGRLAQKDNNLVNLIPDILSQLIKMDDLNDENLHNILKFLFNLVDTTKRAESLVDRFCSKFTAEEDFRINRSITLCLSLITYNDKALRKLHEKFPTYKSHLHDAEIYAMFKEIIETCSKPKPGKTDLKPIATEIDKCIMSVFEMNEAGQPSKPPPVWKKPTKRTLGKQTKKKKAKKHSSGDSDSEFDVPTPRKQKKAKIQASDTDDSEDEIIQPKRQRKMKSKINKKNGSDSD